MHQQLYEQVAAATHVQKFARGMLVRNRGLIDDDGAGSPGPAASGEAAAAAAAAAVAGEGLAAELSPDLSPLIAAEAEIAAER